MLLKGDRIALWLIENEKNNEDKKCIIYAAFLSNERGAFIENRNIFRKSFANCSLAIDDYRSKKRNSICTA